MKDTLYANEGTQVYLKSYIEVQDIMSLFRVLAGLYSTKRFVKGAVDFIFGSKGQAYFEGNVIASKGAGCITASGREVNDSTIC